jgi:hypothetical protein
VGWLRSCLATSAIRVMATASMSLIVGLFLLL